MPYRDHNGKLQGEYYAEISDKAHEEREIARIHDEGSKRDARTKRRIEAGDLTTEEWQWEIERRDRDIEFWKAEWQEKMGAITDLCQARSARRKALKGAIELCRRLRDRANYEGSHDATEALSELLVYLMEVEVGHHDKPEQEKEQEHT